jgi:haloalkane dehalogenase
MAISAAFPFAPHYVEVEGARLHFVEQGTGHPVVFLHGNPTWSYLWRNIIPIVAAKGRCIAPDLIGFGKSDKPNIAYNYLDHVRYVDGFIRALDLTNVTLVLHDWGGAFGFDYALRHRDNVKALAFFEAVSFTFTWDTFPRAIREEFKAFRTPGTGWKLICEDNAFIERVIPGAVVRQLSEEEMNQYRMPFPTVESRKPVWVMPNTIPFSDRQDEAYRAVKNIEDGLPTLTMPTLLLWARPGTIVNSQERVSWYQQRLPALDVVDLGQGIHYLQEDHPEEIGQAIVRWLEKAA